MRRNAKRKAALERQMNPPATDRVSGPRGEGTMLEKELPQGRGQPTLVRPGAVVADVNGDGPGIVLRVSAEGCGVVYPKVGRVRELTWHEVRIDHVAADPEFIPGHNGGRAWTANPRMAERTLGAGGLQIPDRVAVGAEMYAVLVRPGPLYAADGTTSAAHTDHEALTITIDERVGIDAMPFIAAYAVSAAWQRMVEVDAEGRDDAATVAHEAVEAAA